MSKVAHGGVHVSQTSAEMRLLRDQSYFVVSRLDRRGQSFFRGQSVVLIVVVSRRGKSFFVVSRLDRRGQSSWSVDVVSRSARMVFIFYGGYAHVFTETYS